MPEVRDRHDEGPASELVAALRGLPLADPGEDGWPRLLGALRERAPAVVSSGTRQGFRRRVRAAAVWPIAAAAAILAAVLWPRVAVHQEPDTRVADMAGDTRALIAQSQWLERLVAADAIDAVATGADQLILEQGLRERIQRIDTALENGEIPGERLWAMRVSALAQLAEVKWAGRQDGWSAMSETASFVPAVMWSN
jgi:hypothetical protein